MLVFIGLKFGGKISLVRKYIFSYRIKAQCKTTQWSKSQK